MADQLGLYSDADSGLTPKAPAGAPVNDGLVDERPMPPRPP
jgi:hypothetical protein